MEHFLTMVGTHSAFEVGTVYVSATSPTKLRLRKKRTTVRHAVPPGRVGERISACSNPENILPSLGLRESQEKDGQRIAK